MNEALEILERAAFTDAEMRAYDKFWDRVSTMRTLESDWEDKIKEAMDKLNEAEAKAEVAEAKAEEANQKLLNTARRMKAKGFAIADIAEITGLTADEIEGL